MKNLPNALRELRQGQKALQAKSELDTKQINQINKDLKSIALKLDSLSQKQADALRAISLSSKPGKTSANTHTSALQADNPALDSYYLAFETKFRGSEDEIFERLEKSYAKVLRKAPKANIKLPVVDIGCGRGELLRLYKKLGFSPLGLDLNEAMIERCLEIGYDAKKLDGNKFLRERDSQSLAGVSGIHLAEHIPFQQLLELITESFRTLAPGGFLLLETPNPENLTVGAFSFWYDSSHLRPIPPDVLAFLYEYAGFSDVSIIRLHPGDENLDKIRDPAVKKIAAHLFGPRDYAVIGYKFKAGNKAS